jgi:hypothetical protein
MSEEELIAEAGVLMIAGEYRVPRGNSVFLLLNIPAILCFDLLF